MMEGSGIGRQRHSVTIHRKCLPILDLHKVFESSLLGFRRRISHLWLLALSISLVLATFGPLDVAANHVEPLPPASKVDGLGAEADSFPALREARFTYRIDRSLVPSWVTMRDTTLVVTVGPALDVVAFGDGHPVSCHYDGQFAVVTTDADELQVIVTAPTLRLREMGEVSLAVLRDDKDWALSITLDDGFVSQATTAKELLDRYGYAASIAIVGARIGQTFNGKAHASAEQLQAVVEAGWQLANHTDSHLRAAEIGREADVVRDVGQANQHIMEAVPGYVPIMFTSPFADNDYTPIIRAHVDELGLRLIQTVGSEGRRVDPGFLDMDHIDASTIGRTSILYNSSQFDAAHGWVVDNPGTHWWLSLHSHAVVPACDCVETATDALYRTYGVGGTDEVWVAPAPVVYQYLIVSQKTTVTELDRRMVGAPLPDFTLPTPEPTPVLHSLFLQQGHQGYESMIDAYIDSFDSNHNHGAEAGLVVRTLGLKSSLLQFNVGAVPSGAIVREAILRVYGLDESNQAVICLEAYRLLRDWQERQVTWNRAKNGDPWGAPGAGQPGVDRTADHVGLRGLVQGIDHWYQVELSDAVQGWIAQPESNHGLLLMAVGEAAKQISLASSGYPDVSLRPALVINYTLPISNEVTLPEGDGLLVGQVLLEGRGDPADSAWSVPLTVTLSQDSALVYDEVLVTGEYGEFIIENIAPGDYDLAVVGAHTLPAIRQGVAIHSGLNRVTLGPLVEGDIVRDGYITARDWAALVASFGSERGDEPYIAQADLNDDSKVDILDVAMLSTHYGRFGDVVQMDVPEPAADASLRLSPSESSVKVGEMITLEVMLDTGGQAVDSIDTWIEFDPQVLELVEASPTGAFPLTMPGNDLDGADGVLHYAAGSLARPISGTLALLQLSFVAKRPVAGLEKAQDLTRIEDTRVVFSHNTARNHYVISDGYNVLGATHDASLVINTHNSLFLPDVQTGKNPGIGHSRDTAGRVPTSYAEARALPIVGHHALDNPVFEARDVRLRAGYVHMVLKTSYQGEFVRVLDVSDVTAPRLITTTTVGDQSYEADEIWVEGDRAYVAKKGKGVDILDVSDPLAVHILGKFLQHGDGWDIAKGVHAVGDRLYVANEGYGLQIVDVTNPGSPVLLGESGRGSAFGEGVWIDGSVAYVAAGRPGVRIYDISDPARPRPLQAYEVPVPGFGRSVDVQVEGDILYVAAWNGGLTLYDVSDPSAPEYLDTLDTYFAQKLDVVDGIVYLADDQGGLVVIDARDPTDLQVVGRCDTPGQAFGVSVTDGHAYVADGTAGLQVVDLAGLTPTPTPTLTATPTPTCTPTSTPTPTSTATPTCTSTATPTPSPSPALLSIPLVVK